jgi:hypothetical protein
LAGGTTKVSKVQYRTEGFGFTWFFIATTFVAIICSFVWCMSPLGIGFAPQPANPSTRQVAVTIYAVSYFVGIPMLLFGQVLSAILAVSGRRRGAFPGLNRVVRVLRGDCVLVPPI